MSARVAINGSGRIGRLALRAAWGGPDREWVHVNEPHEDAAISAHPLTFDSVHGRSPYGAAAGPDGEALAVDGTQVEMLAWYDNEWGYANRLVELARTVAASLP